MNKKVDKESYDIYYRNKLSKLSGIQDPDEYITTYEKINLYPYHKGGTTKGYVRGLSVKYLFESAKKLNRPLRTITVLDTGCGQGELSVYLACKGFNVIGIDISQEACICARHLAESMRVTENCTFFAESLESLHSISNNSIDLIIGHAALHHFIKYEVPREFKRIMKLNAHGFFADSYGENKLYHLFHDKQMMSRLGDVILTKRKIEDYFKDFELHLVPTDWFAMLDKLYEKFLPKKVTRSLSRLHYAIDRTLPTKSRLSIFLSGAIMTEIINVHK